jgi:hypothetical protein
MAGIERGTPSGEAKPQQPRQPEQTQPLQGRAVGRESLQGPTTVDRSEQPKTDAERLYGAKLKEIHAVYEKDPTIFATRTMEMLDWLLKEKIPAIEQREEEERQELISHLNALGRKPDTEAWAKVSQRRHTQGYRSGLADAFLSAYERITGRAAYLYPPGEEPEHSKDGRRHQP